MPLALRTMLILIDDLDRCQPETVVKILEAINFLTSAGRCYIVIGMARELVEPAVGLAFRDIADEISHLRSSDSAGELAADNKPNGVAKRREFAREYLEKLINLEIPVPTVEASQALALLGGQVIGQGDEEAAKNHLEAEQQLAREQTRQRWATWMRRGVLLSIVAGLSFWLGWQQPADKSSVAQGGPITLNETGTPGSAEKPVNPPTEKTPVPIPPPEQKAPSKTATLIPGATSEPPIWFIALTGLLLLFAGFLLLARHLAPGDKPLPSVEEDTPGFKLALGIWNPVIASHLLTPRRLRRFMNRIRYMAVRLNVMEETPGFSQNLTEQDIVTLSTLHLVHPDCLELVKGKTREEFLTAFALKTDWRKTEELKAPSKTDHAAVIEALRRFEKLEAAQEIQWAFDNQKIELLRQLLEGIRVH